MKLVLVAFAAAISGCAGLPAKVTASTDRAVIVSTGVPSKGVEVALALADAECRKRSLRARLQGRMQEAAPDDRYIFECVPA